MYGFVRWAGLNWAMLLCGFVGSWVALGFVWVSFDSKRSSGVREAKRKIVVGTRAKLCQLFASSQRLWKVGHAINHIYYGEILGASRSIRTIDSYIYGQIFEKNVEKPCTFIKFLRFSGGKSDGFATAKGRRGYAKRSERSSLVRGRSFVNFLQVHKGSGRWVTQ